MRWRLWEEEYAIYFWATATEQSRATSRWAIKPPFIFIFNIARFSFIRDAIFLLYATPRQMRCLSAPKYETPIAIFPILFTCWDAEDATRFRYIAFFCLMLSAWLPVTSAIPPWLISWCAPFDAIFRVSICRLFAIMLFAGYYTAIADIDISLTFSRHYWYFRRCRLLFLRSSFFARFSLRYTTFDDERGALAPARQCLSDETSVMAQSEYICARLQIEWESYFLSWALTDTRREP